MKKLYFKRISWIPQFAIISPEEKIINQLFRLRLAEFLGPNVIILCSWWPAHMIKPLSLKELHLGLLREHV